MGYCLACDIGTTTINISLLDEHYQCVGNSDFRNAQALYGSDVLNRIMNICRNGKLLYTMQKQVLYDVFFRAFSLWKNINASEKISRILFSGNTTMISILLGLQVDSLGKSPFTHELSQNVTLSFKQFCAKNSIFQDDIDTGMKQDNEQEIKRMISCILDENSVFIFTGCSSAFIGGDILSGLIYVEDTYPASDYLLLDFGTNGEMVLKKENQYFATSTACGPAFEGCLRKQKVYGATALEALNIAIKTKKISESGILNDTFQENGLSVMGVLLTSDIIRQLLLAKAAIRTGIDFLLKHAYGDIKKGANQIPIVYLAGGFGERLDCDCIISLGLFPKELKGKIKVIGNSSLHGACACLKEERLLDKLNSYTRQDKIKVLQLVHEKDYQDSLISNMYFRG